MLPGADKLVVISSPFPKATQTHTHTHTHKAQTVRCCRQRDYKHTVDSLVLTKHSIKAISFNSAIDKCECCSGLPGLVFIHREELSASVTDEWRSGEERTSTIQPFRDTV